MEWFLVIRFEDPFGVCSLHVISRNHSNTFLLINLQKKTTCLTQNIATRAMCRFIGMSFKTGLAPLLNV